jgi:thiamine-phosphate pyrophosphorylase
LDELRLVLVTDRHQTRGRDLVRLVGDCVVAGLPAIQVREKDLGALEVAALCRQLLAAITPARCLFVVNDRVDVALAVGASGVQRTSTSLPVSDIRDIVKNGMLIGASVHSLEESIEAEAAGADWVTFGPVYDTPSKRAYGAPQGLGALTPERVEEVRGAGARGVAVISAILAAESPASAVRAFREALDRPR